MRYAILFSGMSLRRHVNGLEFCYRTLVDRLGFDSDNVRVLNFDGSLAALGDPEDARDNLWPGDGSPFRMAVTAQGSRDAFRDTLRAIGDKLTPDDDLFINTTGHGGHHGNVRGPDLLCYPYGRRYRRDELCSDIAALPPHRSLVVLMAQCFSGGFNQAIVTASPAQTTFIASATSEMRQSFQALDDEQWDSFQRNWLAGLAGQDVNGARIVASGSGAAANRADDARVTVHEAFEYARTCTNLNPYDSPEFAASSASAGNLTLAPDAGCGSLISSLL